MGEAQRTCTYRSTATTLLLWPMRFHCCLHNKDYIVHACTQIDALGIKLRIAVEC